MTRRGSVRARNVVTKDKDSSKDAPLDVVEIAENVDTVILASGDGDFDKLLERIHARHGVTTEAYGVPELTAASLKNTATRFVAIDERLLLGR